MFITLQGFSRISVSPFCDPLLFNEVAAKALFWINRSFYGVDISPLHAPALAGYFAQVGDTCSSGSTLTHLHVIVQLHVIITTWVVVCLRFARRSSHTSLSVILCKASAIMPPVAGRIQLDC